MIVEKGGHYLDSDGRQFICSGFGAETGYAYGEALDPRPKRWRHLAAGYDETWGDVLGGTNAVLVCPYPANDWHIVAFFKFAPDQNRTGFTCRVYGELIA